MILRKYQNGKTLTVKGQDGTITNRVAMPNGDTKIQVKTKDGKYSEKIIKAAPSYRPSITPQNFDLPKSETTQAVSAEAKQAPIDILNTNYRRANQYQALVSEGRVIAKEQLQKLKNNENFKNSSKEIQDEILKKEYARLNDPQVLANYAVNRANQAVITNGKERTAGDYAERIWDIVTNPLDAFTYSVKTGDVSNMPWHYNRAERAGYQDPMTAGNNVAKGIDFVSYFHPVGGLAHAVKDTPYTIADIHHAAQTGKLEDWKKAGESTLYNVLDYAPSKVIGSSGRLLAGITGDALKFMHLNKKLGLNRLNTYIGPRLGSLGTESISNTRIGKLIPQIDPASQLYNPKARALYNSVVEGGRLQNADQAKQVFYKTEKEASPTKTNLPIETIYKEVANGIVSTEDWFRHPATRKKIVDALESKRSPYEIFPNDEWHLNHEPEFPILDDANNTATGVNPGLYDPNTKLQYINRNWAQDFGSTTAHERRHAYDLDNGLLNKTGMDEMLSSLIPERAKSAASKFRDANSAGRNVLAQLSKEDPYATTIGYLSQPEELAAHIQEIRYRYGLQPGQKVTPEILRTIHKHVHANPDPNGEGLNYLFSNHVLGNWEQTPLKDRPKNWEDKVNYNNVATAFNKLYIAPVALAGGAAATLLNNPYKKESPVKFRNGGVLYKNR
jgi:hypothetical protein